MKYDVVCLGELVIDLIPVSAGTNAYQAKAGGAPGNVAVGLARLGKRSAMLSRVGDDAFGDLIISVLAEYGVEVSGVVRGRNEKTGLAVVSLAADGDRRFTFYREGAADLLMGPGDVNDHVIASAHVLHVGSSAMASPGGAAAHVKAMDVARAAGAYVSVDPNLRPALWPDCDSMLRSARRLVANASILKVSEDELVELTGGGSVEDNVRAIWHPGLKLVAVTKGSAGAELFTETRRASFGGFAVATLDTTGAGDAFAACLLGEFLDAGFDVEDSPTLEAVLKRCCAAGALSTTRNGGMESLPDKNGICRLIASSSERGPDASSPVGLNE